MLNLCLACRVSVPWLTGAFVNAPGRARSGYLARALTALGLLLTLLISVRTAAGQTYSFAPSLASFQVTNGTFGQRCDLAPNISGCVFCGTTSPFAAAFSEHTVGSNDTCGSSTFDASASIGGWQNQGDNAIVRFRFLDINRNQTGIVQLGPVTAAERGNQTRVLPRSASGYLPAGTRFVRIELEMYRTGGTNNDGYVQSPRLSINPARLSLADPEAGVVRAQPVGGTVQLNVAPQNYLTTPTISWISPTRGLLQDGTYPDGLTVAGATTPVLTLTNLRKADDGIY